MARARERVSLDSELKIDLNRLGGREWLSGLDGFPPNPKGMRWKTYYRLMDKCDEADEFALASIYVYLRKLAG